MNRIPQALFVGGRIAKRSIVTEHAGQRSGDPWVNHESLALMVHPADIPAYTEDARRRGVPVEFSKSGMPQFRSHSQQKRYCRAYEYANYGDYY